MVNECMKHKYITCLHGVILPYIPSVLHNCIIFHNLRTLLGLAGKVISSILEAGFEISMMEMFHMEKANAEEFYEVYKGVVQEYGSMVAELTSGPCLALEIRAQNAPQAFREMVGPSDPVCVVLYTGAYIYIWFSSNLSTVYDS